MTCQQCKVTTPATHVGGVGPYRRYLCSVHAMRMTLRCWMVFIPIEAVTR